MGEKEQRRDSSRRDTRQGSSDKTLEPENCLKIDCVYGIMQIICKVKKPSVSISSKLNVALMQAARSKRRPPGVTPVQLASAPTRGDWTRDVHPPRHSQDWVFQA